MPANSESQARLFRMAYAVRKGKIKRSDAHESVLKLADSDVSDSKLKEFFTESFSLKDYLSESLEINEKHMDFIYHFSPIFGAIDVMKNDTFKLNDDENRFNHMIRQKFKKEKSEKDWEDNINMVHGWDNDPLNYMSCTRWKQIGGYSKQIYDESEGIVVRFNLDGRKLASKYKIVPFQYVAFDNHANAPGRDARHYNIDPSDDMHHPKAWSTNKGNNFWDQREERLISKNEEIKNFSKYLLDVDILIDYNRNLEEFQYNIGSQDLRSLGYLANNYPVQINVYGDIKDFNAKNGNCTDLDTYLHASTTQN